MSNKCPLKGKLELSNVSHKLQGVPMGTKTDNCPHCHKDHCVPVRAFTNVENYGSGVFKVVCVHCKKPIVASLSRRVILNSVKVGTHKHNEGDF